MAYMLNNCRMLGSASRRRRRPHLSPVRPGPGLRPSLRVRDWCGRGDSNPHGKTPNGFSYQLRLSPPPKRRLWSGLSLHPSACAV